jgi:hypothetical protein
VSYKRQTSRPERTVRFSLMAACAYVLNNASPRLSVRAKDASSSLRISVSSGIFLVTSGKMPPCHQLERENTHQALHNSRNKGREEGANLDVELAARVPNTSPEDSPQYVTTSIFVGHTTIRDGDSQGPDVIGDDSVSGVNSINVLVAQLASV